MYTHDRGTYTLIRRVMALPFLPAEEILPVFERLQRKANTVPLLQFFEYVEGTWIRGNIWPPATWSAYLQAIRTNNDIEGWHNGLNRRAQGKCSLLLYMLIALLHQESRLSSLQIRLVSERKLKKIQRKTYRELQTKVFNLWDEYGNGEKTAKQLMKACAYLHGPRVE